MEAYEAGAHAYHSTMPTESLRLFRDVMNETVAFGFEKAHQSQQELGQKIRALLASKGFQSVAAVGFEAPCVVVCYTENPSIQNGSLFNNLVFKLPGAFP